MCNCVNIEIGSYGNQVELEIPPHMESYKQARIKEGLKPTICVDQCLESEIAYLWSLEIQTTGCCCGHNKLIGYIGVEDCHVSLMKEMGYKVHYNNLLPEREDSFIPKSI